MFADVIDFKFFNKAKLYIGDAVNSGVLYTVRAV